MLVVTMKSKVTSHFLHINRLNDDMTAAAYMDQALQVAESLLEQQDEMGGIDKAEQVGMAITYNNLSVIALKQGGYVKAIKSAKLAVSLMEPQIF